jgi:hypothetical protein
MMFEFACEIANDTDKQVTLEIIIPEASKPDKQVLEHGQSIGVFKSATGSTIKITITEVKDD